MIRSGMAGSYGKIPRGSKKTQPPPSPEVTVTIHGTYSLEGISRELQILISKLNDRKAHGVRQCRVIFEPVDRAGEAISLQTDDGRQIKNFSLNAPPAPPVFSDKA